MIRSGQLVSWLVDARTRTLELIGELEDHELAGDATSGFPPPLWLLGHLVWLYEDQVLVGYLGEARRVDERWQRFAGEPAAAVGRASSELPALDEILPRSAEVQNKVLAAIMGPDRVAPELAELLRALIDAEDWVGEHLLAFAQHLGRGEPLLIFDDEAEPARTTPIAPGDVDIPELTTVVGADRDDVQAAAIERPAHPVVVPGFAVARTPVTETEFAAFVEAGGYRNEELWSADGWAWCRGLAREAPRYWKQEGGHWFRRDFDRWDELDPNRPVSFLSYYEAEAYCAFVGRRLPTEAEWELAAGCRESEPEELLLHPWGDHPIRPELANLDGRILCAAAVGSFAAGDSPWGLRQMLGNVWEWTSSPLLPYPGFQGEGIERGSELRVIRGGSFATRSRFLTCHTRRGLHPGDDRFATSLRTVAGSR